MPCIEYEINWSAYTILHKELLEHRKLLILFNLGFPRIFASLRLFSKQTFVLSNVRTSIPQYGLYWRVLIERKVLLLSVLLLLLSRICQTLFTGNRYPLYAVVLLKYILFDKPYQNTEPTYNSIIHYLQLAF